jgi:hypothetical protein
MADVKISELPVATSPLAGTETVPIVQAGATKQVAVSEFTGSAWDGDIADIDLDGGTDIGAALAGTDLILVDYGANGTIAD